MHAHAPSSFPEICATQFNKHTVWRWEAMIVITSGEAGGGGGGGG